MKAKIYTWFSCLALLSLSAILTAQTGITPNGISYQAIARDDGGKELTNIHVLVRFSIIDENNNADWVETHSVTTDQFGLFNLTIGDGSKDPSSKVESFAKIPWGTKHYALKVEIRTDQDDEYRSFGTMPFLSVPYALYAASSGNALSDSAGPVDLTKYLYTIEWDPLNQHYNLIDGLGQIKGATIDLATYKQTLSLAGRTLSISNGNSIPLPPDADIDSTNELQSLSILNNQLSLINRNGTTYSSVSLTPYMQDLNLSNNTLKISNNPTATPIDLTPYKQTLSINGRTLSISNGNSISLPPDADIDSTNELQSLTLQNNQLSLINKNGSTYSTVNLVNYLQDLKLTNDTLKITNNNSATSINLKKYLDNTDNQQLTLSNGQLSLTNGGSVNIRESLIAFRAVKNTSNLITPNQPIVLVFDTEVIDNTNSYNNLTGTFHVPDGGSGLYSFTVNYDYQAGSGSAVQVLKVFVNGTAVETLQKFNSNGFLLLLNTGDDVYIQLVNNDSYGCGIGSFMGYRINQ